MNKILLAIGLVTAFGNAANAAPYDDFLNRVFGLDVEVQSGTYEGTKVSKVVLDESLAAAIPKWGCAKGGAYAYLVFVEGTGEWTYAGCAWFEQNGSLKQLPVFTN